MMDELLPTPSFGDDDSSCDSCYELKMSPASSETTIILAEQPPESKTLGAPPSEIRVAVEETLQKKFFSDLVIEFLGFLSNHFVNTHKYYIKTGADEALEKETYLNRMTDLLDKKSDVSPTFNTLRRRSHIKSVVTLTEDGAVTLNSGHMDFSGFWTLQSKSDHSKWDLRVYVDDARFTFSIPFSAVFKQRLVGSPLLSPSTTSDSEGLPSLSLGF